MTKTSTTKTSTARPPKAKPAATAAIFDLDRTLLSGSSGPVFQRHLAEQGLGTDRSIPGLDAYYKVYELVGESAAAMQLAKLAVKASAGWDVAAVAAAAESAADELVDKVLPFAKLLIEEHREAGRPLVVATTTPSCLVGPLADRLGFDHVVATRWAVEDDKFTGALDGPFVWGREKLASVKRHADEVGISVAKSYAYSDSVYDVPLLRSSGHPVAVNPDPQLAVVAALNKWPIRHFDVSPGVAKIAGKELQDWIRPFNRPAMAPYARFDFDGIDNIPSSGGVIVVFNHRSYFDSTVVNFALADSGRPARFLGKKEVFDVPIVGKLTKMLGGIRVDRGTGSNEPLELAIQALKAGELIAMAPQGTIPRGPAFFDPELQGRWGAARLAAATGVPVIPMGMWGTEVVWPRSQRVPNLLTSDPPMVTVRVGNPVELTNEDLEADTKAIMTALSDLLPAESRDLIEPTAEQLLKTYPPGYSGKPDDEATRRPGSNT